MLPILLSGFGAWAGMQTRPDSQLTPPERWERAVRSGGFAGVTALAAGLIITWACFATARRNYRAAQLVAVAQVGFDRAKCALPASRRLYDPGGKLSPVLVCTASEVLHLT